MYLRSPQKIGQPYFVLAFRRSTVCTFNFLAQRSIRASGGARSRVLMWVLMRDSVIENNAIRTPGARNKNTHYFFLSSSLPSEGGDMSRGLKKQQKNFNARIAG
jgi:hypothetical protein